jgi:hypothetical protein
MSAYRIPLARQELLHHMLQVGGAATVELSRPEQTLRADFSVELTDASALIAIEIGGRSDRLTLKRRDRANHLHLRDFIEEIANGQVESAREVEPRPLEEPHVPQTLSELDERALRTVTRTGGQATVAGCLHVTVHLSPDSNKATGIVGKGSNTRVCSGSRGDVYASLASHAEELLAA